jgi:hypothetical protein
MSVKLTDQDRRRLRRYVKRCRSNGQQATGSLYDVARAMLALDQGRPSEDVAKLLLPSVEKLTKPKTREESRESASAEDDPKFEKDLDYVLEKNAELYRRLAR